MEILLIDDDRVFLKYLACQLEVAGHDVLIAEDGVCALSLLADSTRTSYFST
jgi:DNA-binding response OmpR family regulator